MGIFGRKTECITGESFVSLGTVILASGAPRLNGGLPNGLSCIQCFPNGGNFSFSKYKAEKAEKHKQSLGGKEMNSGLSI